MLAQAAMRFIFDETHKREYQNENWIAKYTNHLIQETAVVWACTTKGQ